MNWTPGSALGSCVASDKLVELSEFQTSSNNDTLCLTQFLLKDTAISDWFAM